MLKILLASSLLATPILTNDEVVNDTTQKEPTLEDKDQNGIPDSIEDYYDKHIRDQYAFGISLGSIIGFASSVIGWLIVLRKNNKTSDYLKLEQAKITEQVMALNEQNEKYRVMINEIVSKNEEATREYKILANKIIITNQQINSSLNSFGTVSEKMDVLLNSQMIFANYSEFVKQDISRKVTELVESVQK